MPSLSLVTGTEFRLANPRKVQGGFRCDLIDASDGCAIATVVRRGSSQNWSHLTHFKFSSSRGQREFEYWCGEESMSEAFIAMSTHLPSEWHVS